ncbi:hypothetical protein [Mesorhizobium sp.]|uniref:hypothetical protein n=1 Tax=Mesorhizobium sp. TaxID=1871066 RepID=UPI00257F88FB|nr:hypothetical protein [Mesorhizobium sp.]
MPRYSNGAFAAEQGVAKAAHRGVWQGRFDQPWDWRDANVDKVETVSEQSTGFGLLGGCTIKANTQPTASASTICLDRREFASRLLVSYL